MCIENAASAFYPQLHGTGQPIQLKRGRTINKHSKALKSKAHWTLTTRLLRRLFRSVTKLYFMLPNYILQSTNANVYRSWLRPRQLLLVFTCPEKVRGKDEFTLNSNVILSKWRGGYFSVVEYYFILNCALYFLHYTI